MYWSRSRVQMRGRASWASTRSADPPRATKSVLIALAVIGVLTYFGASEAGSALNLRAGIFARERAQEGQIVVCENGERMSFQDCMLRVIIPQKLPPPRAYLVQRPTKTLARAMFALYGMFGGVIALLVVAYQQPKGEANRQFSMDKVVLRLVLGAIAGLCTGLIANVFAPAPSKAVDMPLVGAWMGEMSLEEFYERLIVWPLCAGLFLTAFFENLKRFYDTLSERATQGLTSKSRDANHD